MPRTLLALRGVGSSGHRLGAALGMGIASLLITVLVSPGMGAAELPDLRPYPPVATGERRWLISVDTPSSAAADQRVELILGRTLMVDCNRHVLLGSLVEESLPGWGIPIYRAKGGQPMASTRMACPGQALRREFVRLGAPPTLVPVQPRLPIVVYAPQDLEVRWRLWRADPRQSPARTF